VFLHYLIQNANECELCLIVRFFWSCCEKKASKSSSMGAVPHAAERANERGISVAEIAEILANPTVAIEQGPKWILAKTFAARKDNMIAAVVLERKDSLWVVITLMVNFEAENHKRHSRLFS
jgi:hypothetical protein